MKVATGFTASRIYVAVLIVLTVFLGACERLATPPTDDPTFPGRPYPDACSDSRADRELEEASKKERDLACLIKNHRDQERSEMHYHPILGEVARMRAEDMAEHGYYGGEEYGLPYPPHVDRHGYGPNYYVCEAGYELFACPERFDDVRINTIEAIGWGFGSARDSVYDQLYGWLTSPGHRRHVLAETSGETEAINYGIGHAHSIDSPDVDGRSAHYWVFISAPPPGSEAVAIEKNK